MTNKKTATKKVAVKNKAVQVAQRKRKNERELAREIDHIPFLPPAMTGKVFVRNREPHAESRNWFGYDSFVVLGNMGPHVVPGEETASGEPYIFPASVLVEAEHVDEKGETRQTVTTISPHEFMGLIAICYDPAPRAPKAPRFIGIKKEGE